jgi:hypothetical protein
MQSEKQRGCAFVICCPLAERDGRASLLIGHYGGYCLLFVSSLKPGGQLLLPLGRSIERTANASTFWLLSMLRHSRALLAMVLEVLREYRLAAAELELRFDLGPLPEETALGLSSVMDSLVENAS